MTGSIYYLTDTTGIPRYVGQTIKPLELRIKQHIYERNRSRNHKNNWINSVGKENIRIFLIDTYDVEIIDDMEKYWISIYKLLNIKLTNSTNGGSGDGSKYYWNDERRLEQSNKFKNKIVSKETRLKISKGNKGKKVSDESKRKMSESRKGFIFSEETKIKMSESKKGSIVPKERRLKISNTLLGHTPYNKGKNMSAEQKLKLSQSLKGRNTKQEAKIKLNNDCWKT